MAPRDPLRICPGAARGAGLASGLWLAGALAAAACQEPPWHGPAMEGSLTRAAAQDGPVAAWFEDPTTRYAHAVLGDGIEAGTLAVQTAPTPDCRVARITLPETEVFEDIAPRLADLDGDGAIEIAYVDRPHLARTLRVWRYLPEGPGQGRLTEVAALGGLTNHRIGEAYISGGLRDCGAGSEIITADASWSRVMATRLEGTTLTTRPLGPWTATTAAAALACRQ